MDEKTEEHTKEELLEKAREQDIAGRSQMTKDELAEAVGLTNPHDLAPGEPTPLAQWRKNHYEGGVPAE
jgi:hypothetical protein